MRIFLRDRDDGNLEAMTLLLIEEGHTLVSSPLEAEILIVDVNLPRDVASCKQTKMLNEEAHLYVTTTLDEDMFSVFRIPCKEIIYKPFDIDEFLKHFVKV